MSIGLGIFASVVLILAVYHRGFRKVLLWTAAAMWKADREASRAKAKDDAAKQAGIVRCMSRLGTPWAANAPPTLPASYFDNLQACSVAPDDYDPFAEFGGHIDWFSVLNSLPKGYTLDQSNHVVPVIDWSKYATAPCSDSLPLGFVADQPCVLSSRVIHGFRREMCIGTIQPNGNCVTELPASALKAFRGSYSIQICPYGLPINAAGDCPSWKNVDVDAARAKLLAYRKQ